MNKGLSINNCVNATQICGYKVVGYSGTFPLDEGNDLKLAAEDGNVYKIVNLLWENLEEAIKRGFISFPIKILPSSDGEAFIMDDRMPGEWELPVFPILDTMFYENDVSKIKMDYENIPQHLENRYSDTPVNENYYTTITIIKKEDENN